MIHKAGIVFSEAAGSDNADLKQSDAVQIINSLRRGVPPSSVNVSVFSVGRGKLLQRFREDLEFVKNDSPRARLMNADWGAGKTHSLHLLREHAFELGFVVSIVTLSQTSCPIYDFMAVYHQVMWNLRTREERTKPALESVLGRWLQAVKEIGWERTGNLIKRLPDDLVHALHAYHESTSPVKHDEEKRLLVFKYLSGDRVPLRELHRIGINCCIDSSSALSTLARMASLFRNLEYKGICILFDEAESAHSFATSARKDAAYKNIFQIIAQSTKTPFCYFLYATTPSFFDYYEPYSHNKIKRSDILELEKLDTSELQELVVKICNIYEVAKVIKVPVQTKQLLTESTTDPLFSDTIGNFVRRCIGILDET